MQLDAEKFLACLLASGALMTTAGCARDEDEVEFSAGAEQPTTQEVGEPAAEEEADVGVEAEVESPEGEAQLGEPAPGAEPGPIYE